MDATEQKWPDVVATTDRILKLNPYDFPDAYFYSSVANFNLRNLPAAEKAAREGIKLKAETRFPHIEYILGLALAQQDNFQEAQEHLKKYLEILPDAANADVVRQQIADIGHVLAMSPKE